MISEETSKEGFRFSPHPNKAGKINWLPWGDLAFHKARSEDKLILLDITAVWCHWCHVMDETAYSDEEVIDVLNKHFVPVRVDNDRRPDINARYNLGGWPTTAFLTPQGDLIGGGTYFPVQEMRVLLEKIRRIYHEKRESLNTQLAEMALEEARALSEAPPQEALSSSIYEEILQTVADSYDFTHGGFGREPKFPQPDALELIMEAYADSRDPKYLQIFNHTLITMYNGGIYDQVEGGFFRYSTTRDWSIPHYEKMLEDHAGLVRSYLHAYALTGNQTFKEALDKTFGYLLTTLRDQEQGYFYGSQDADEVYYSLDKEGRSQRSAPLVDKILYVNWNAKMSAVLWEAAGILGELRYAEVAQRVLDFLWAKGYNENKGFCHSWDGRPGEGGLLADQIYVGWAHLEAYRQTLAHHHLDKAQKIAQGILAHYWDPKGGCFDTAPGHETFGRLRVRHKDFMENSAFAALAMDLYRTTGQENWRDKAQSTLTCLAPHYKNFGAMAGAFALTVKSLLEGGPEIDLLGQEDDSSTRELAREAQKIYIPFKSLRLLSPDKDKELIAKKGYAGDGLPKAYLCAGQSCRGPLKIGELEAALKNLKAA